MFSQCNSCPQQVTRGMQNLSIKAPSFHSQQFHLPKEKLFLLCLKNSRFQGAHIFFRLSTSNTEKTLRRWHQMFSSDNSFISNTRKRLRQGNNELNATEIGFSQTENNKQNIHQNIQASRSKSFSNTGHETTRICTANSQHFALHFLATNGFQRTQKNTAGKNLTSQQCCSVFSWNLIKNFAFLRIFTEINEITKINFILSGRTKSQRESPRARDKVVLDSRPGGSGHPSRNSECDW